MVVSVSDEANWIVVTSFAAAATITGVMILSCVSCKCWRRLVKKDITDDEENNDDEGEVYSNPSFDDAPQKANVETKRKTKHGSSVVINSPNNSIEPYQEVPEGLVLQNRFAEDKKNNLKGFNEFSAKNGDLKGAKADDDKSPDTERTSQAEFLFSSSTGMPDVISNTSTFVVSVEVHCTDYENRPIVVSQPSSNNCTPKQRSVLESQVGNEHERSMDKNGVALHINPFAVEMLEEKMKNTPSLQNTGMSIAL